MKRFLTACLVTIAAVGCDRKPVGPEPGTLSLNLTAASGDVRGMLVRVTGPAPTSTVEAGSSSYLVRSRSEGNTTTVAVFGELRSGVLLRLQVPDVNQAEKYDATVTSSTDAANALQQGAGHTLTITR